MRIDEILAGSTPVFSFEFFPPRDPEGVALLFDSVEALKPLQPDFVSVTYGAGGATRDGTVDIATQLKHEHGLETMAHLSCVGETRDGLVQILDRLEASGIENVLALRGDPPRGEPDFTRPEGGLGCAAELAAFISERYDFAIGGACFPEVHPEADSLEGDLAYLKTKVTSGARFLITQLFFDNRFYFDLVARARAAGITVPIVPGLMPVPSRRSLKVMSTMSGASVPPALQAAIDEAPDDDAIRAIGVQHCIAQCVELLETGVPGLHFYTFNRARAPIAILAALRGQQLLAS
jgi:methylenetetrahydrofolate reductase (NADPH)